MRRLHAAHRAVLAVEQITGMLLVVLHIGCKIVERHLDHWNALIPNGQRPGCLFRRVTNINQAVSNSGIVGGLYV